MTGTVGTGMAGAAGFSAWFPGSTLGTAKPDARGSGAAATLIGGEGMPHWAPKRPVVRPAAKSVPLRIARSSTSATRCEAPGNCLRRARGLIR